MSFYFNFLNFQFKKFPLFKSTNSVVFKLETAMFQWFHLYFFQYFKRDGYQSNFLDEINKYRSEANKRT